MPIVEEAETSRLLADGRITAITIDTNIFDEKGLQLNSAVLQAMSGLRDRQFAFILTGTVTREIRRHIERATDSALQSAKKAIGHALYAFETAEPTRDALLEQISGGRSVIEAAEGRFDAYIAATGCEILNDATLVDTATIYDSYFAGEPPFGSGAKKNEFPDALALNALERVAIDRRIGIIVVSKDTDWHAFCKESQQLYLVPEIERALALINAPPVVLREAVRSWLMEGHEGRAEVGASLESEAERIEFSVSGNPTSGEMEVVTWAGELKGIEWPTENEIDIVDMTTTDDGISRVLLSLPLRLDVRLPVELNFSVWDSVDRESIGMGSRTIEVDETIDTRAMITVEAHRLGEEDENLELVATELDMSFHEIDLGDINVFEMEDIEPEDR